jgi:two-component system, NarL family, response regulator DevR
MTTLQVQRPGNVRLPTLVPTEVDAAREVVVTTDAVLDPPLPALEPGVGSATPLARRTARLLIVDGEAIVRFGLRQLFAADPQLAVVGEAASPRDALMIADRCPPDLVILDIELGRGDAGGVDLARMLLERHRGVRVLVLTGNRDREAMMRTVRLGVHGYLRKGAETADITRAVHALLRGESVFDSRSRPVVVDVLGEKDRLPVRGLGGAMLTERENQVLRLLAVGMSNREIGGRLVISEATVKFHVRNLRDKLDVRRRTEIVYTATRQGIV